MTELAVLHEEGLLVSSHELDPEHPGYDINSLDQLGDPEHTEVYYFLGGDAFLTLDRWPIWRELVARLRLVVLARPGFSLDDSPPGTAAELLALVRDGRAIVMEDAVLDISSTALRAELKAGKSPSPERLHPEVLAYIRKYSLYR